MSSPLSRSTQPALTNYDFVFNSRDTSPFVTEPSTPFVPPYPLFSSTSWPSDFDAFPPNGYHGDLPLFGSGIPNNSNGMPLSTTADLCGDTIRGMQAAGANLPPDSLPVSQSNQPSYYVATGKPRKGQVRFIDSNTDPLIEAALPQLLQVINVMFPQSKVIVLVPPESPASACIPSFPPPSSYTGFENPTTIAQQSQQSLACLCYSQSIHARSRMDTESYLQSCPIHEMSNSSAGSCPVRML
jgi:hypothetical protein